MKTITNFLNSVPDEPERDSEVYDGIETLQRQTVTLISLRKSQHIEAVSIWHQNFYVNL